MAQVDYKAILDEAWQQHLESRASDAPTVISLFAGCGGSSLGYSMAGFREVLVVEWNDNAVATFKLNFPDVPVYHGDIAKLSVDECLELAGIEPGQLDVLDGSPPCQGFSTAGKRQLDDPRNQLAMEFVRLLRGLRPKVFVMENVSGLIKGKMKLVFAEIMRELKASGYKVKCRLMNAMYFQVPQSRRRLIWIGTRDDLKVESEHPGAEATPITVKEGLCEVPDDSTAFVVGEHTNIYQDMKTVAPGGHQPGHHSHIRLPLNKSSPALLADAGFGHYHFWHPVEHRVLTFNELKVLSSFPTEFQLVGKPGEKWANIGNSVPPLFMRAIARHIRRTILDERLAGMGLEPRLIE